jgi:hypothetical protein
LSLHPRRLYRACVFLLARAQLHCCHAVSPGAAFDRQLELHAARAVAAIARGAAGCAMAVGTVAQPIATQTERWPGAIIGAQHRLRRPLRHLQRRRAKATGRSAVALMAVRRRPPGLGSRLGADSVHRSLPVKQTVFQGELPTRRHHGGMHRWRRSGQQADEVVQPLVAVGPAIAGVHGTDGSGLAVLGPHGLGHVLVAHNFAAIAYG